MVRWQGESNRKVVVWPMVNDVERVVAEVLADAIKQFVNSGGFPLFGIFQSSEF
jgi:hypothetical protein